MTDFPEILAQNTTVIHGTLLKRALFAHFWASQLSTGKIERSLEPAGRVLSPDSGSRTPDPGSECTHFAPYTIPVTYGKVATSIPYKSAIISGF